MHEPVLELAVRWERWISPDRSLLDGLLARHREKHRRYHNATHVAWVLRHVEELTTTEPVMHPEEVVAAGFYHDAVYEPASPANERASARLARRDLATLAWDDAAIDRVGAMIEATEHGASGGEPSSGDTAILLDADLAILGADPAGYATYLTGIRQEYRHIDDDGWHHGRSAVIRSFLDRPQIYTTPAGRSRWEPRARANLAAELATLHR